MSEHIQSVERAAQVLKVLSDGGVMGLTEIARKVDLGNSTTHRILASLSRARLVRSDSISRKYMLGFGLLELTAGWLGELETRSTALPYLRELRQKTGETVSLNVRDYDSRVPIERLDTSHEVRFMVELGRSLSLHVGAGGKAILAFLEENEICDLLESANLGAKKTRDLSKELEKIRRVGWAFSIGERLAGAGSISAPVFNHGGFAIASISILCLESRLKAKTIKDFGHVVRETALQVSHELGWSGVRFDKHTRA